MTPKNPLWLSIPALKKIKGQQWEKLMLCTKEVQIPMGTTVFHAGEQCENYLFVVQGTIRVIKIAENGREIVLYRVESGETCILTTSCMLSDDHYPAEGITETDVSALMLPATVFHQALALSEAFRGFVFASFGDRISNLITLVEAVALRRGDARLAEYLLKMHNVSCIITTTHHEIAAELGTAREVVSRLLKELELQGFVQLGRNRVEIIDPDGLQKLITTS